MLCIFVLGNYIGVANSLYTFSSTPFLHDENLPAETMRTAFYFPQLVGLLLFY